VGAFPLFFLFFLASGLCGLVYQVVWLRLAMASFGVTAPMISIVVSVFMAGLALGSWGAGALMRRLGDRPATWPLRLYGLAELMIALSAQIVPPLLGAGREWTARMGAPTAWGSLGHNVAAGAWVALVLLPFCVCMGATYPLAMAALRGRGAGEWRRSFSYLYLANITGALLGVLLSAFVLIELLGFRGTLNVAAAINALLAAGALLLSLRPSFAAAAAPAEPGEPAAGSAPPGLSVPLMALLFTTGFVSMGFEVVWARQFTPFLGGVVYAFALILAVYLAASSLGSALYRRMMRSPRAIPLEWALVLLGPVALLPLLAADPRLALPPGLAPGSLRLVIGLAPFCALLGFVTPLLMDRHSGGDPARAGSAYAVNVVGCILGPLIAAFLLLPRLGDRWSIVVLALPLWLLLARPIGTRRALPWRLAGLAAGGALVFATRGYEQIFPAAQVRRDYTATVIAMGTGMERALLVNGIGMTALTPITKTMAHLPMAALPQPPRSSLVVCLGMGTTLRSLHSWGAPATAVELVPSVPSLLGYFHADGDSLRQAANVRIVVDDGRRYLERTQETFDVITIDPPPPVEAAGSSLLYSREFYRAARARLRPGGILQQWIPFAEPFVRASFAKALAESFPHVRAYSSVEDWGVHMLASDSPLPNLDPAELARRLPPAAAADFVEWGPGATPLEQFARVADREIPFAQLLGIAPLAPALVDDRPVNEYYFLRRLAKGH
jgi:spermidine synthase